MIPTSSSPSMNLTGNVDDVEYLSWVQRIEKRFIDAAGSPLFDVLIDGSVPLFDIYLGAIADDQRQYHTCNTCRQFVNRYGRLATVDAKTGELVPVMWSVDDAPDFYKPVVLEMARAIRRGRIDSVFLSEDKRWGTPKTGDWTHFAVTPPAAIVYENKLLTASQKMAERREDHRNVLRGLSEYRPDVIEKALALLRSEALYRAEHVIGPVEWLQRVHETLAQAKASTLRSNLVWLAVAQAPSGFCHPRSSMAGTLLDDLATDMPIGAVTSRFAAKMNPLAYQRPQAPPTEGNLKRGEEIVEKLGIAKSLLRRFARPDDVTNLLWTSTTLPAAAGQGGVFGHLKAKGALDVQELTIPETTMTWEKFARTMLPNALNIELYVNPRDNFTALTTAVDPTAPPILQWDHEEKRNPVAWYVWGNSLHGGSPAAQWSLRAGAYAKIWGIAPQPSQWNGEEHSAHHGKAIVLLVEGMKETGEPSMALFPEILKTELREIRSTIEAYSRAGKLANKEGPHAAGLALKSGGAWNVRIRVTTKPGTQIVKLDRWD